MAQARKRRMISRPVIMCNSQPTFTYDGTEKDQKHICPLQLDVIERVVSLWSTEDDIVFTPFMGIGSECYVAVKNNRKAIGIELKESYYNQAVLNVAIAENTKNQNTLF